MEVAQACAELPTPTKSDPAGKNQTCLDAKPHLNSSNAKCDKEDVAGILALRRAGTSHQNYPEKPKFIDGEGSVNFDGPSCGSSPVEASPTSESPALVVVEDATPGVAAKSKRFDFGMGVTRCSCCASKIPRLNRGCKECR